jgi:DNA-binding MarR family transcriptional regulator
MSSNILLLTNYFGMIRKSETDMGDGQMEASRNEREHEALRLFRDMNRAMRVSTLPLLIETDLSIAQLRTLFVLSEDGPMMVSQVARQLGIGISTAGHLVDRLVRLDFAQRQEDTGDRRRVLVSLSMKGKEFRERLHGELHVLHSGIHDLTDDELAAFIYGMQALARKMPQQNDTEDIVVRTDELES